jgi:hypothetical protein
MPQFERGARFGDRYAAINQILVTLAAALNTDLWTLDALFWRLEIEDEPEVQTDNEALLGIIPAVPAAPRACMAFTRGGCAHAKARQRPLLLMRRQMPVCALDLPDRRMPQELSHHRQRHVVLHQQARERVARPVGRDPAAPEASGLRCPSEGIAELRASLAPELCPPGRSVDPGDGVTIGIPKNDVVGSPYLTKRIP